MNADDGNMKTCLDAWERVTKPANGYMDIDVKTVRTRVKMSGDPKYDALITVATCFSMETADSKLEDESQAWCEHGYNPGVMSISCSGVKCTEKDKEICCAPPSDTVRRRRDTVRRRRDAGTGTGQTQAELDAKLEDIRKQGLEL